MTEVLFNFYRLPTEPGTPGSADAYPYQMDVVTAITLGPWSGLATSNALAAAEEVLFEAWVPVDQRAMAMTGRKGVWKLRKEADTLRGAYILAHRERSRRRTEGSLVDDEMELNPAGYRMFVELMRSNNRPGDIPRNALRLAAAGASA